MNDADCVQFLQWALPRLRLRWPGFRRVRRQVCHRVSRRLAELGFSTIAGYQAYLDAHPAEWPILDRLCWISISRFYRDQAVFRCLEREILPHLARQVIVGGEHELNCWSMGCASGEEPYAVAILWKQAVAPRFPGVCFDVLATDVDAQAIERARRGCFAAGSLKELPSEWREQAFTASADGSCLKDEYRAFVSFHVQDVRKAMPDGPFDLILCRYLVFTYFDEALQRELLDKITGRLRSGGALVTGSTDSLPSDTWPLESWLGCKEIYRKR